LRIALFVTDVSRLSRRAVSSMLRSTCDTARNDFFLYQNALAR